MPLRIITIAFILIFLWPLKAFAQRRHRRDVTLTVGRQEIRGSAITYRRGTLIDGLMTAHVHPSVHWSPIVAGGINVVFGNMPECAVQPDGRCAPSGTFLALNTLVGIERSAGRVLARLFVGPTLHSSNEATSIGIQGRLALTLPVDELIGVGIMLRATRLSSHRGEALTLWALGGSLSY